MNEQIRTKLRLIINSEDMNRIRVGTAYGECRIIVDVHGMKCGVARKFINNIINLVHAAFHLLVIHGYNGGVAIKQMLLHDFDNMHVTQAYPDDHNLGRTHLIVA